MGETEAIQGTTLTRLRAALGTTAYTSGSTHHFYHYPARFHPDVAHAARAVLRVIAAMNARATLWQSIHGHGR